MKELLPYIIEKLTKTTTGHEIHSFDSGVKMVDIWLNNNFYVLHIESKSIGLSQINDENISFDNTPDRVYDDEVSFKEAFEKLFYPENPKKTIIIDGRNFSDLDGFYSEVDKLLTKDLNIKTGHNLDAFNDLLRGGFGVFGYREAIKLIWLCAPKSKAELKSLNQENSIYSILVDIIKGHNHIEFLEN